MGIEIRVKFKNGNAESMFFTKDELAKAKRIFNKTLDFHKDENVDITWRTAQVIY